MKKISLRQISGSELSRAEMKQITGGAQCSGYPAGVCGWRYCSVGIVYCNTAGSGCYCPSPPGNCSPPYYCPGT